MASSFGECFGSTRSRLVPELQAALEELGIKDPGPDMVETRRSGEARRVGDAARENPPRPPPSPLLPLCMRVLHSTPRSFAFVAFGIDAETDLQGERALTCTVERLCKQLIRDESMLVWMILNDGLGWVILICAWTNLG